MFRARDETQALGRFILKRRLELGLTQRELAIRLGWDQSDVSKLENGKVSSWPNSKAQAKLAEVLQCEEWELWNAGGYTVPAELTPVNV